MIQLETKRLILRPWCEGDLDAFAAMNGDARIMEFFPFLLTREESGEMIKIFCQRMQERGVFYLPIIEKDSSSFIGMVNLTPVLFEAQFTPAVEIGWRLAFNHWGKGYATEAAASLIEYGFGELKLDEIVSFTTVGNKKSSAVMKRLGMEYDGEFDHPGLPQDNPLRRHALYRLARPGA